MEAVNVTDMNTKYVELDKGTWLVDGEIYNNASYNSKVKVIVKNFENIRKVSETTYISHYLSGGDKMSVIDFNEQSLKLLTKRKLVGEDMYVWDSLEDEFEYRKFIQSWTKVTNIAVAGGCGRN